MQPFDCGLVKEFADGIWWIELVALTDPDLVSRTVAITFGCDFIADLLDDFCNTLRWNVDGGTEVAYNRSLVGFAPEGQVPMESIKLMMDWNKI